MLKFKIGDKVQHNGGVYEDEFIREFDTGIVVELGDKDGDYGVKWSNPNELYYDNIWYINENSLDLERTRGFEKVSIDQWMKDDCTDGASTQWEELYNELKLPKRATKHSAGYDVFSPFEFTLEPMEDIKIPTGFKSYMLGDEKLMGHIRSSLGFKYYLGLSNVTMVGDSDYYNNKNNEGHYWIKIRNNGNQSVTIKKGEAFAQVMFEKYLLVDGDSFNDGEERIGGIGSTTK